MQYRYIRHQVSGDMYACEMTDDLMTIVRALGPVSRRDVSEIEPDEYNFNIDFDLGSNNRARDDAIWLNNEPTDFVIA